MTRRRSGLRVPPGFVLRTEALETHLREARIGNTIRSLCDEADFAKAETRASVSTAIRDLICGAALPEVIRDELITRAHPLLARGPIVVPRHGAIDAVDANDAIRVVRHHPNVDAIERTAAEREAAFGEAARPAVVACHDP